MFRRRMKPNPLSIAEGGPAYPLIIVRVSDLDATEDHSPYFQREVMERLRLTIRLAHGPKALYHRIEVTSSMMSTNAEVVAFMQRYVTVI